MYSSRREAVLLRLNENANTWVEGWFLCTPDCGGSEGLRRLRELRNEGYDIQSQPSPDGSTAWQYMLVTA